MAMAKRDTIHPDWEFVDAYDLEPPPGAFVSTTWSDFMVEGESVHALNWLHAEYLWLKRVFERCNVELGRCSHCGAHLRYVTVFRDPEGGWHPVGRDCAKFLSTDLPRDAFERAELIATIRTVLTKNGNRAVVSMGRVPNWFWSTPRAIRPLWASMRKEPRFVRGRKTAEMEWRVSIWGTDIDDVITHIGEWRHLAKEKMA